MMYLGDLGGSGESIGESMGDLGNLGDPDDDEEEEDDIGKIKL